MQRLRKQRWRLIRLLTNIVMRAQLAEITESFVWRRLLLAYGRVEWTGQVEQK